MMSRLIAGLALLAVSATAQTAWVPLSGTTFNSALCPPDGTSGSVTDTGAPYPYRSGGAAGHGANNNCGAVVDAWSGGVSRTKAGSEELYFLGQGGHGDYGGNEVYVLDLHSATNTFTRVSDPSTLLAVYYTNSTKSYPDGKPSSRHRYDGLTYLPNIDKFFVWSGASYGGNGTHYFDGWLYDPTVNPTTTNPWTEVIPSSAGGCENIATVGYSIGPDQRVTYNPNDGLVYIGAATHFWKFNPTTSCYTHLSSNNVDSFPMKAIMDTTRNRILHIGGSQSYFMSVTGVNTTATLNANCNPVRNTDGPGGFYDSVGDVFILYPQTGGNTLYALNPTTLSCATITTTGGPTGTSSRGMWGRFGYFPSLGKIAVLAYFGQGWYTLAYSAPVLTAPTITTTSLPGGTTAASYSQTLAATGNPSSFTWSVISGALPTGLSLNSSTGAITGTPTFIATSSFTVQASNGVSPDATQALSIAITGGTITPGANTLTITNTGSTTTNYPVQIGRAFVQGSIPSGLLPRAAVNNVSVNTQVDVKNVWPDGSLKYAIVSFLIPTFTSGSVYTIAFVAGATVGNTALTQAQMQAGGYNFDAVISLTRSGVTKTASARTMLNNGDYTAWASGPIATTILLGSHAQSFACVGGAASGSGSTTSRYDFGFTSFCAFRPLFQATFWAGINKVYIRYIGEVTNTQQLEDVVVDSILLTSGSSGPSSWYTHGAQTMNAQTRWTKTTWIGGTPPAGAINHNLTYLSSSYALPNYDTTRPISAGTITTLYSNWTSSTKDIYQKGIWDSTIGAGGGHTHVAPYPEWTVQYLYTGDIRMQEIAIGQAELLSSVEWHFREGNTAKKLDRAGAVSGVGYPLSISTRPTINTYDLTLGNSGDRVIPVGTVTLNNLWGTGTVNSFAYWGDIISHPPEIWFPTYLLTGDHYFLEEGQFQAAFMAAALGAPATGDWRARGPTGAEGGIIDRHDQRFQTRGQAWAVRSRAELAWISPDADQFKAYLTTLMDDNLAYWEGQRYISGTAYQGTTMWNFGQLTATANVGTNGTQWDSYEDSSGGHLTTPSPLHFWDAGNSASCDTSNTLQIVDTTPTLDCGTPWFESYMTYALGRATELGYAAAPLRNWIGGNKIASLTDAGYNPWLTGAYRVPVIKPGFTYFTTWAQVKAGFLVNPVPNVGPLQAETDFYPGIIFSGCQSDATANCQPLVAALSMVADQTNGATAWNFINTNIVPSISNNVMWAIIPRTSIPSGSSGTARGGNTKVGGKVNQ